MEKTKKCTKCGRVLPLSEFNKNKNQSDGHQCQCRDCTNEYWREYYRRKHGVTTKPTVVVKQDKPSLNPRLADFQPRELIEELRARNYKGKLYITREIIV